jgi:hypothetical protein
MVRLLQSIRETTSSKLFEILACLTQTVGARSFKMHLSPNGNTWVRFTSSSVILLTRLLKKDLLKEAMPMLSYITTERGPAFTMISDVVVRSEYSTLQNIPAWLLQISISNHVRDFTSLNVKESHIRYIYILFIYTCEAHI